MTEIQFFVPGNAAPGGSKTATVIRRKGGAIVMTRNGTPLVAMRDAGKNNKEWRATVADIAQKAYQGPLLIGALDVRFEFIALRPQGHYRGGDRSRGLRPNAPRHVTKKPDVLKLARAVEDALTGVVWVDDCLTVDLHARKRYGDKPGCLITITVLDDSPTVTAQAPALPLFEGPEVTTFMETANG